MDQNRMDASIDPAEIEKFAAIAAQWWDPSGKFRPLHQFNPARLGLLREAAVAHFGRDARAPAPLEGLRLLDIGCGGGLVAEPMRRLGARVVGIDAAARNIEVARLHAAGQRLDIDYRATTVGALIAAGEAPFDIVLCLEVVEHVPDPAALLKEAAALTAPGGLLAIATINRTLKALALAKIGAEYILGWLPRGAHDPRKFLKPAEVAGMLTSAGLDVGAPSGVSYFPLSDAWRATRDVGVNYLLCATRPRAPLAR
jgi:2-polyprenyl-6-hydroxyphenyl methylase/3-demethylubiquinone-9 3-methyltransferase